MVTNYTLIAMPLFVFMGVMLEKSRLAEDLMEVIAHAAGNLRGGLGIGIIVVGVLMGATTGIVGATVVTLGLLTLPTLLRRGYDKGLSCGVICASGTLGQIIPPSLILILLADILNESVGTLFAAAMIPGLMLAGIYVVYILGLGILRPELVPPVPKEERDLLSRGELWGKLVRVVLPPIALVGAVLGSIIGGIAAPTEAASMGALGAIVVTAIGGRMSWAVLRDTTYATTRITAMMMFILMCAQAFSLAFRGLQGERLVQDLFAYVPGGTSGAIWFLMLIIFILGFFIEWIEISYIAVPLFLPIFIAAQRRHGVARHADLREPADLVPDAAVRLGAVLPARRRAAGDHDRRHLSRHRSVRRDAAASRWSSASSFPSWRSGCQSRSGGERLDPAFARLVILSRHVDHPARFPQRRGADHRRRPDAGGAARGAAGALSAGADRACAASTPARSRSRMRWRARADASRSTALPIEESYDLVVVGGGISGLAAAWFYRRAQAVRAHPDPRQPRRFRRPRQAQRVHARWPPHHRLWRQPVAAIAELALQPGGQGPAARSRRRHHAVRDRVRARVSIRRSGCRAACSSTARRSAATCW